MPANTPNILKEKEIPLTGIQNKRVSVIGYGNQGRAHALNLRDSGIDITIGARNTNNALRDGFNAVSIEEASTADLLIIALPDEVHGKIYNEQIAPHLLTNAGQTLGFIHGFAIHYGHIIPPQDVGVVMVAPKGPGITVREKYVAGSGVLALLAIEKENASKTSRALALGWANGIGSARIGVLESTFKDETETDLFGEQAIIVGGLVTLIKASYETLVDAGYPSQLAYIECCHEVKQVADIIHARG
ncbi:MAG: ketol-acid reductoisomerase, partial [Phycisphaerae bacterium]|nr:ketol-acid reductoisomerase [Phycisphaerae bacterium]